MTYGLKQYLSKRIIVIINIYRKLLGKYKIYNDNQSLLNRITVCSQVHKLQYNIKKKLWIKLFYHDLPIDISKQLTGNVFYVWIG